jgi:hypothetical protein
MAFTSKGFIFFALVWEVAVGLIYGLLIGYDTTFFNYANSFVNTIIVGIAIILIIVGINFIRFRIFHDRRIYLKV